MSLDIYGEILVHLVLSAIKGNYVPYQNKTMQSLIRFNVTQDGFSMFLAVSRHRPLPFQNHVMLRLQLLDVFGSKSVSWELVQGFGTFESRHNYDFCLERYRTIWKTLELQRAIHWQQSNV